MRPVTREGQIRTSREHALCGVVPRSWFPDCALQHAANDAPSSLGAALFGTDGILLQKWRWRPTITQRTPVTTLLRLRENRESYLTRTSFRSSSLWVIRRIKLRICGYTSSR